MASRKARPSGPRGPQRRRPLPARRENAAAGPNRHHEASVLRQIGRFGDWLYSLTGDGDSEAREIAVALAALRQRLGGDVRTVAAALIEAHGPRIRLALHPFRDRPEVRAVFEPRPSAPVVSTDDALRLVERCGPRAAAVALARRHGLGVFDRLNAHAREPGVRELLDLVPRRGRGRPAGHTTHNVEAYVLAEVIDLGISHAELLSALGRNPKSTTGSWPNMSEAPDWKWLRRRVERGRALRACVRAEASSTAPARPQADMAIVAFLDRYCRDMQPNARLAVLAPYLLDAIPGQPRTLRG